MPNCTRLVLTFKHDASVPDVSVIIRRLRRSYMIGYCGLFELDHSLRLYIQTSGNAVRMTPSKVLRICQRFGAEGMPTSYKHREGTRLAEKGEFREVGAPKGPRQRTADHTPTTVNNISTTNNTHNDNRVFNDNREIHIHLNALGSEDVSHIKMEQFKSLFDGSTTEIVRRMRGVMTPVQYQRTIELAWDSLQNDLYNEQYMDASQHAAEGIPTEEDELASCHSDTNSESSEEGPPYDSIIANGALIKYDGNIHSEYNRQAKEKVRNISICDLKSSGDAVDLPAQFAQLLSENLSNCNVVHPKNAGYFEYFDGTTWVKKSTADVDTFVSVWRDKVKECFDLLGERHGDAWLGSFQASYAAIVIGKFKRRHLHKPAALLAVDNANSRIKAVESLTGKRVRRVCLEDEGESRRRKVRRNVTWGEMMNQF